MLEAAERFALQDLGLWEDDSEAPEPDLPRHEASVILSAWIAQRNGTPLADSYLEQDASLTDDVHLFTRLYNAAYEQHRPQRDTDKSSNDDWLKRATRNAKPMQGLFD